MSARKEGIETLRPNMSGGKEGIVTSRCKICVYAKREC